MSVYSLKGPVTGVAYSLPGSHPSPGAHPLKCSLTSPDWDVSAFRLHYNGGHGHGDRDGIEVGGMWCQCEDSSLSRQGLPSLHSHSVEAASKPHGTHDGLEQEIHNPVRDRQHQVPALHRHAGGMGKMS